MHSAPAATRFTRNESNWQDEANLRRRSFALNSFKQKAGCCSTNLGNRLTDCGDRGSDQSVKVDIVETNEGNVLANSNAERLKGFNDGERTGVVSGKERIWALTGVEERFQSRKSIRRIRKDCFPGSEPRRLQCLFEGLNP